MIDRLRSFITRIVNVLNFSGLSIRKKIVLFLIGALFWFCVVSGVAFFTMFETSSKATELVKVIGPQEKALDVVIRKLRASNSSVIRIVAGRDKNRIIADHRDAEGRLRDIKSHLEKLLAGGVIKDYSQSTGNLYDEFLVVPLKDQNMRSKILEIRTKLEKLEKLLDSIATLKSWGARTDILENKSAEYDALTNDTLVLINECIIKLNFDWNAVVASIGNRFNFSMVAILANFLITVVLSIVFGTLLSQSMRKPLRQVTQQISALSAGEITLTKKIDVSSKDELQTLAEEFNKLLDSIYAITSFKKVIEGDQQVEDIYARLGKIFKEDLGFDKCFIFQVVDAGKTMKVVYPPEAAESAGFADSEGKELYCDMDVQLNTGECRAKRTGESVSSLACPGICKYFVGETGKAHICIPVVIAGNTDAVVQFVCNKEEECDIEKQISRANQYLREAQPVLEAKGLLRALKELSLRDPLTGISNRRCLDEMFEGLSAGIIRRGSRLGLLMCDLDFFKAINDTFGHDVGDMVLKETAAAIRGSVRNSDLVIRFGGEEFLVLLVDIKQEEAAGIAEKIRKRISEMKVNAAPGVPIHRTISVGVSEFPTDAQDFRDAVKCADLALYRAKEAGRNRVVRFEADMWTKQQG